jgi:hypothetical protein
VPLATEVRIRGTQSGRCTEGLQEGDNSHASRERNQSPDAAHHAPPVIAVHAA